jgi:hypothetical protein
MEESAFIGGVVAGIVYFAAGVHLIRLSWRTQAPPQLMLGIAFVLWAISYACWQIPIATANQPLTQPLFFAGRVFTNAGIIFLAYFVWVEFRNQSRWARYLVYGITFSVLAGTLDRLPKGTGEASSRSTTTFGSSIGDQTSWRWLGSASKASSNTPRHDDACGSGNAIRSSATASFSGASWASSGPCTTECFSTRSSNSRPLRSGRPIWIERLPRLNPPALRLFVSSFFPPRFYQRWIGAAAPTAEPEEA